MITVIYVNRLDKGIFMSVFAMIGRRLLIGLLTLLFVSVLVFAGTEILPGDVAYAVLGQAATPESLELVRNRLGLNEPVHVRYFVWLFNFVRGDFGASLATFGGSLAGQDIGTELLNRGWNTMLLAGSTALIAVPLAIFLGLTAAIKPGGLVDRILTSTSLALISFPDFLVAVLLVTVFAIKLRWLPAIASIRPVSYTHLTLPTILIV